MSDKLIIMPNMKLFMQNKYDIVIIGGGPIGLKLAELLGDLSSIAVIERRNYMDYENSYKGYRVMSKEAFELFGLPEKLAAHEIEHIAVYSPSLKYYVTAPKRLRGFVVEKSSIEQYLYKKASEKCDIFVGVQPVEIDVENKIVKLSSGKELKYKYLIGADGVFSFTRKYVTNESIKYIRCVSKIFDTKKSKYNVDGPSVFFVEYANGFYGWVIPSYEKIEVGIGSDEKDALKRLNRLIGELRTSDILYIDDKYNSFIFSGGIIPITYVSKVAIDNILLVGDATGGEPLLGSSLHKGIQEGLLVKKVLEEEFENTGEKYQELWSENIKKELDEQLRLRSIFYSSYEKLENSIAKLNEKEIDGPGLINGPLKNIIKIIMESK